MVYLLNHAFWECLRQSLPVRPNVADVEIENIGKNSEA
jgi:hypothetical protein